MFVFLVGMSYIYIYVEYCSVCVSCRHVLYIYVEYCSVWVSCRHVLYIYM